MKESACKDLIHNIKENTLELSEYIDTTYPNRKKVSIKERMLDLQNPKSINSKKDNQM